MRIAHVTATFPPHYTGTGMVCYHNAVGLARLGHEVTVFTAEYPLGDYVDPEEITVRRLPALFRFGNAPFLPGLLGIRDFDIVHLHYPFIFGAELVWLVSKMRAIPYILTHHNDLIGEGLRRYLFDGYSAVSSRLVVGGARRLIAVSLDHAEYCRLAPLLRRRWEDVVEVPNGVDTELFRPGLDGSAVRRRWGVPIEAKVVLFVGPLDRAHHYRRVDLLLEAIWFGADPDLHLLVAGDGDRVGQYRRHADSLALGAQVHFLGEIAHEDLPTIYAAADIVALPSQMQESFGLVLVEAMSCGKPVVASNLPGVRTVVCDGEDGLLAEAGNVEDLAGKLQIMLDGSQQRIEMGKRGRAKVEREYDWPGIVSQLVQVYEETLINGG